MMSKYFDRLLLNNEKKIQIFINDPTDGSITLGDSTREMLFSWCYENCKGRYWIGMGYGSFENNDDAFLFKLTWG